MSIWGKVQGQDKFDWDVNQDPQLIGCQSITSANEMPIHCLNQCGVNQKPQSLYTIMPQYFQKVLLLSTVFRQHSARKLHIGDGLKRCCGLVPGHRFKHNPGQLLSLISISVKWANVLIQNPNYTIVNMTTTYGILLRHSRKIAHDELGQNDHKILIST